MTFYDKNTIYYLAQINPNSIKIAQMNLNRQGFKTFLPMIEATKRCKGKFVKENRPLFPGYIFVAFDIGQGFWHRINSTYGIKRLVSFNKTPAAVPQDLICQLMLRFGPNAKFQPPKIFKTGDKVTVINGPFVNFVAQVEKIASDQRAWLLIEIMGTQTRVSIEPGQLRKICNINPLKQLNNMTE